MTSANDHKERPDKRSLFELFTEIAGWLQIMASPFLAGVVAGAFVYLSKPGTATLVIAISVATTGLVIGIIWANKIFRKRGTVNFLSGLLATPELDDDISKNDL